MYNEIGIILKHNNLSNNTYWSIMEEEISIMIIYFDC